MAACAAKVGLLDYVPGLDSDFVKLAENLLNEKI